RTLSNRTVERLLALGQELDLLTLVMLANRKLSSVPRTEHEREALAGLQLVENVGRDELRQDYTMRISFLGEHEAGSEDLVHRVEAFVGQPMYLTHFPLAMLPSQRGSTMQVVDAHAPCRGKAEALRVLYDSAGILPERVVAVGDASNDVPMLQAAGLGVAMANSTPSATDAADRVIGDHDSDAIADLIGELFLG
ncbi:MAG: hydroxymethylpyrimidine pyrophosphatase-like HAD family hydrolase, partial [Gammaproteobacteria bacterium]